MWMITAKSFNDRNLKLGFKLKVCKLTDNYKKINS